MTIDDQLRDIARRADQLQQVITAEEVLQRASSQGTRPFTTGSRFNDDRTVVTHIPVQSEEEATMIDLETPSQNDERHKGPKRFAIAAMVAAAAVVAIALVTIREDDSPSPADQPPPTVAPTAPPQALFSTPGASGDQLTPGTYFLDQVGGSPTSRIFVTLGDGWSNSMGNAIGKEGIGGMTFSRPELVYKDACHWTDGLVAGPATTLDGLVAALSEQGGWVDVTPPGDASVDGYSGRTFRRTVPPSLADCDAWGDLGGQFRSWTDGIQGYYDYLKGEIDTLRILDVDGTIIVINTRLDPDHQGTAAVDELAAVLDSISIEQP